MPLSGTSSGDASFLLALDGAGDVTHISTTLPYGETRSVGGGNVTATLLWTNTTGLVDMDVPSLQFTVTARVRFDTTSGFCLTNTFQATLDSGDFAESYCPSGGYDFVTGEFCMRSSSTFTIPALGASACNSSGNAINSEWGLGSSGAGLQLNLGTALDQNGNPIDR